MGHKRRLPKSDENKAKKLKKLELQCQNLRSKISLNSQQAAAGAASTSSSSQANNELAKSQQSYDSSRDPRLAENKYVLDGDAVELKYGLDLNLVDLGSIDFVMSDVMGAKIFKAYQKKQQASSGSDELNSCQIDASCVNIQNSDWGTRLNQLVQRVGKNLGCHDELEAKLEKAMIYKKGAHYEKHKDEIQSPNVFAKLIIQLPSYHRGGQLIVYKENDSSNRIIDSNLDKENSLSPIYFVAFRANLSYEMREIVSGYRLELVYLLSRVEKDSVPHEKQQLEVKEEPREVNDEAEKSSHNHLNAEDLMVLDEFCTNPESAFDRLRKLNDFNRVEKLLIRMRLVLTEANCLQLAKLIAHYPNERMRTYMSRIIVFDKESVGAICHLILNFIDQNELELARDYFNSCILKPMVENLDRLRSALNFVTRYQNKNSDAFAVLVKCTTHELFSNLPKLDNLKTDIVGHMATQNNGYTYALAESKNISWLRRNPLIESILEARTRFLVDQVSIKPQISWSMSEIPQLQAHPRIREFLENDQQVMRLHKFESSSDLDDFMKLYYPKSGWNSNEVLATASKMLDKFALIEKTSEYLNNQIDHQKKCVKELNFIKTKFT